MLKPTKYMKLEQCTLRVAAMMLSRLQTLLVVPVVEIDEYVRFRLGEAAAVNLVPALSLLYIVGLVEYDEHTDSLVYLSKSERAAR